MPEQANLKQVNIPLSGRFKGMVRLTVDFLVSRADHDISFAFAEAGLPLEGDTPLTLPFL